MPKSNKCALTSKKALKAKLGPAAKGKSKDEMCEADGIRGAGTTAYNTMKQIKNLEEYKNIPRGTKIDEQKSNNEIKGQKNRFGELP